MIVTDGIHIAGETLAELRAFADRAGIKRCWFHRNRKHPHYDKPKRYPLPKLIAHGATHVRSRIVSQVAQKAAAYANEEARST